MFKLVLGFLVCLIPVVSFAECKIYTVKKGDDYAAISNYYFKDGFHKFYLEKYNNSAKLVPGKKVAFLIPEYAYEALRICKNMINSRLTQKRAHKKLEEFTNGIPLGLATIATMAEDSFNAMLMVDMCAFSLATAEVNTDFNRLDPPKDTLSTYAVPKKEAYRIFDEFNLTKKLKELNATVEDSMTILSTATFVYIVYFTDLWSENRNVFKVLIKYYGREKELSLSALNTFKIYLDLLDTKYSKCSVDEVEEDD